MDAESLGSSVVFRERGPMSACVGEINVVKSFIVHKVREVDFFSLSLTLGENGC